MDDIQKIIVQSVKELPFTFNDDDILIISEWGRGLFQDGYSAGKTITNTLSKINTKNQIIGKDQPKQT